MSDNDNTQYLHNELGSPSTCATNEKLKTRSRSKEILKIMEENEDVNKAQQTLPPSNSSKKIAERKRKKDPSKKVSTSTRKKRKTSNEKSKVGQNEVSTLHVNKTKGKSKLECKYNKKKINKNSKHGQGEAPPTYPPQQFIGLYICKEYNGVRNLGTVLSYDPKTKLFQILYDNDKTNDMELAEILKSKATAKDIFEARQTLQLSNSSEKNTNEEMEKATISEEE
ncbi:uncharacterized protein LOC109813927 isoform X2 [Cajanus cajan]|uniref:uncharacterized protein LOC109813927 isoform X2 n=1 Tax=Cajanus cajan TaxID=3821 RepID=UPI00098D9BDB|nr:uncharacterized protein LOC109813927 isoform X2 [Cajanus cajan]